MNQKYRETSEGGLALYYLLDANDMRTTDLKDEIYNGVGNHDLEDAFE